MLTGRGNLFEFEGGPELVAELAVRRIRGRVQAVVTFATADGPHRLRFDDPEPLDQLYPIVDAEQVWVYQLPARPGELPRIKVEYYAGEFHELSADAVLDLDPGPYATNPDVPLSDLVGG